MPEESFAKKDPSGKRRQSYCRPCQRVYRQEHYQKNKTKYRQRIKDRRVEERIKFYAWLSTKACVDCGNADMRVLEFDHLRDKKFSIAEKLGDASFETLQKEIEKCEVVCANCHKIRTATRANHYHYMH